MPKFTVLVRLEVESNSAEGVKHCLPLAFAKVNEHIDDPLTDSDDYVTFRAPESTGWTWDPEILDIKEL